MELFSADDFENKDLSAENTEETLEETTKEASPESEAETKAEEPAEQKADESEGSDSGAESPKEPEYTPDFSYKVKNEEHEFPEWIKGVVTDKEKEEELRDLFTKVVGLDSIKESRDRIESEFSGYQQSVQNEIFPVLDRVREFDQANQIKDFGKAWELSNVNPHDVVDYMLMDEQLSQVVAQKLYDRLQLEEQGPQAIASQRAAWQEQTRSKELELQNKSMETRLQQMEESTFNQALDFTLSQHADAAAKFDSMNGEGAFRKFIGDYRMMKKQQGENLSPADIVSQSISMLGLNNQAITSQGTQENNNQPAKVAPKEQKQPEAIPNIGTGANVSMVQKTASTWEEWEKGIGSF